MDCKSRIFIYQVLPRLWKGGTFQAFDTASLDYVRSLGMTHVWYTGVIDHATRLPGYENAHAECVKGTAGSPYSIRDYYAVAPYLGTMADFEALVERTHQAGLKVIIDFVPNHVARENVNFGRSDNPSVHWAPENDFYYYPGQPLRLPSTAIPGAPYTESPARASGNAFTPAPDINDWWDTVRLNYCDFHTATWDKMLDIIRFWLGKGVDGFRCDMVEMVPWQFLRWLIASAKAEYPDALFIAEAYNKDTYRYYIETVGFDLLYDKCGLYDTLRSVTCDGASAQGITRNWQMLGDLQPHMLNFLENHDEQRVASPQFAGCPEGGYAALSVSLLFSDTPFMLYFAQEWGERGGTDGRTSIFDLRPPVTPSASEESAGASSVIPGPVPGISSPVFRRYAYTLRLAQETAGSPTYDLCWCQGEGFDRSRHFAWLRALSGEDPLLLVANFAPDEAIITVRIPAEALSHVCPGTDAAPATLTVRVPGRDFVAVANNSLTINHV